LEVADQARKDVKDCEQGRKKRSHGPQNIHKDYKNTSKNDKKQRYSNYPRRLSLLFSINRDKD